MKKIAILIVFLVMASYSFGQDTVKIEGYPTTTTTTNSHYVTVYTETPSKAARKMYAEYSLPFIYSSGIVRPRALGTNMVVGSTTNPYADKLYVNGNLRASGTGHFTETLRLGNPSFYTAIYQHPITGELIFNDPVNGVHNMSEFLAAGSSTGSTVFDSISTTYVPKVYTNNWNFGGEVPSTYKVTVTGSLRATGETHLGAVNYDTYIYGSEHIMDGSLNIGSVDDTYRWVLFNGGSQGLSIHGNSLPIVPLYLHPHSTYADIMFGGSGLRINNTTTDYLTFSANNSNWNYNGTYFYNDTDTLATRAYARGYGGSEGDGGVVDTAGGQAANQIAYWTDKNTLGGSENLKFVGSTLSAPIFNSTISGTGYLQLNANVVDGPSAIAYSFKSVNHLVNETAKIFEFSNQASNRFYQISSGRVFNENGGFQAGVGTTDYSDFTSTYYRNIVSSTVRMNLNPSISDGPSAIAYLFDTKNSLSNSSAKLLSLKNAGTEKFYINNDSTVINNYLVAKDSLYLKYLGLEGLPAGSVWITNSPAGAADSANTEPAYIGWEMKDLPTLEEYEKDVKMINGHMERRVWYIDYETKELKSQYGWDGLGMMNTQSAYMIYHEITVRWMFEQNKKLAELEQAKESDINLGLDVKFLIGLLVFVALMGLIVGFRR